MRRFERGFWLKFLLVNGLLVTCTHATPLMQLPKEQRAQLQQLFAQWFASSDDGARPNGDASEETAELQRQWSQWHWRQSLQGGRWRLQESKPYAGYGNYELNRTARRPAFIQAPHHPTDLHTGAIAERLFNATAARAWMRSTLPRNAPASDGGNSDMAHRDDSPLLRASLAFARVYPQGQVIQIHAFEGGKRKSAQAGNAEIILSNGTAHPDVRLLGVAQCLRAHYQVRVYGRDVRELGATQNSIGRGLRAQGFAGFMHIELSQPLRRQLLRDETQLARLARCLNPS